MRPPSGERLRAGVPHGHWRTTTFVSGLRLSGIDAPMLIDGAINGESFLAYVQQVLVPTLRPGDLIVNGGTHVAIYLGNGQMLESGSVESDSPKYPSYVSRIVASGKHLLSLIEHVLDYAEVESGRMVFTPEAINVPHALQEAVEILRADSVPRRVEVHSDIDEGIDLLGGEQLAPMALVPALPTLGPPRRRRARRGARGAAEGTFIGR